MENRYEPCVSPEDRPPRRDFLQNRILLLDGGMGTMLQQRGLPPGGTPELLNLTGPELLASIHREYIDRKSVV